MIKEKCLLIKHTLRLRANLGAIRTERAWSGQAGKATSEEYMQVAGLQVQSWEEGLEMIRLS